MVYWWISLRQWSKVLGHGKFHAVTKKTVNVNTSRVKSSSSSPFNTFFVSQQILKTVSDFYFFIVTNKHHPSSFSASYIPSSLLVWPFDLVPCFNSMANLQVIASNLQRLWTIRTIDWRSKNRKLRTSEVGGALSKHFLNQFTWQYKSEVPQRSK